MASLVKSRQKKGLGSLGALPRRNVSDCQARSQLTIVEGESILGRATLLHSKAPAGGGMDLWKKE